MDPLIFRSIERLASVFIGGFSIFLGYRLFSSIRGQSDGKGTFQFPMHTSVVLTKVGPGVFFALFGTVAVCAAIFRPLDEKLPNGRTVSYAGMPKATSNERADGRALLRRDFAVLNTVPGLMGPQVAEIDRGNVDRGLRRVKLLLMKPVWGEPGEGFGNFAEFESWATQGETGAAPAASNEALALYRYGAPK
jgi:hypothetical protein